MVSNVKKRVGIVISVFIYIALALFYLAGKQRELIGSVTQMHEQDDGTVIVTGNCDDEIFALELSKEAGIQKYIKANNSNGKLHSISAEEKVYILLNDCSFEEKLLGVYELVDFEKMEQRAAIRVDSAFCVTDFYATELGAYICGIDKKNDKVFTYHKTWEDTAFSQLMVYAVNDAEIEAVDACYYDGSMYITFDNGTVKKLTGSTIENLNFENGVTKLHVSKGGMVYQDKQTKEVLFNSANLLYSKVIPLNDTMMSFELADNAEGILVMSHSDGEKHIRNYGFDGENIDLIDSFTWYKLVLLFYWKNLIIFGAFYAVMLLVFWGISSKLKMIPNVIMKCSVLYILAIIMIPVIVQNAMENKYLIAKMEAATLYGELQRSEIGDGKYSDWIINNAYGVPVSYMTHVIAEDAGNIVIEKSSYAVSGTRVNYLWDMIDWEEETLSDDSDCGIITIDGERYVAALVQPATNAIDKKTLITVSIDDIEDIVEERMVYVRIYTFILVTIVAVIAVIVFIWFAYKIGQIRSCTDNMVNGNFELEERKERNTEFYYIWKNLVRISNLLQKQSYAGKNVLQYYFRFAPVNFETLFGKERLSDVENGSLVLAEGDVEIIYTSHKKDLLNASAGRNKPDKAIKRLNRLLDIVSSKNRNGKGILVPGECSIGSVKLMYKDPVEAIKLGIESMALLDIEDYDKEPAFIFIHSGTFLCGMAGNSEIAYPYVTSPELEFLDSYSEFFREMGIRMIITGQSDAIQNTYQIRHIGYISYEAMNEKIEIYEVLDALKPKEKYRRKNTMAKFKKGIELYYAKDYYLARNYFSDVLKESPNDGVSKWYLFTCEELLNSEYKSDLGFGMIKG